MGFTRVPVVYLFKGNFASEPRLLSSKEHHNACGVGLKPRDQGGPLHSFLAKGCFFLTYYVNNSNYNQIYCFYIFI